LDYLAEHGMTIGAWTFAEAQNMLTYHLLFGMCTGHSGAQCKMLTCDVQRHEFMTCILESLTNLCLQTIISCTTLRFVGALFL